MLSSLNQSCRSTTTTSICNIIKNQLLVQQQQQKNLSFRRMSSTAKVWIDKNTRVICQGFTGKQVRINKNIVICHWRIIVRAKTITKKQILFLYEHGYTFHVFFSS
jgi:hypothetical protein